MQETDELEQNWEILVEKIQNMTGKTPDLNGVLMLIGVQELGQGIRTYSKEEKQDLMHIAICRVLSASGVYELEGKDEQGWPHWKLVKKMPFLNLENQEKVLKEHVIEYFRQELAGW